MEDENFQFEPIYGTSNRMTWAVFTEIGSDFDTLVLLRNVAETKGIDGVKAQIETWVEQWFEYKRVPEGIRIFVPSMLNCGIDYTGWWNIVDALQESRDPQIDNPFTGVLYEAVSQMDWQDILADPLQMEEPSTIEEQISYILSDPNGRLKEHIRTLLMTWAESRARRKKTPAQELARKVVKVYLDQVDWEKVYEKYISS